MANNYLQFSEVLPDLAPDQLEWLRIEFSGPPFPDLTDIGEQEAFARQWFVERGFTDPGSHGSFYDMAGCWPGFEYQLRDGADIGELWVYAGEFAELDQLADIIQRFLRRFQPDGCFGLTWAETCSKPRVGEFGGGAVFVTAKSVKWMSTGEFIVEQRRRFEQRKQSKQTAKKGGAR